MFVCGRIITSFHYVAYPRAGNKMEGTISSLDETQVSSSDNAGQSQIFQTEYNADTPGGLSVTLP